MARHRRKPASYREVIAPGALRIPDEVEVTLDGGPRIGTARLAADDRGVTASISLDGDAGLAAADAILTGNVAGLSFRVEPSLPVEAVVTAPQPGALDPVPWHIVSGHRHRHAERTADGSGLTGWREHDHLGGGQPHRHDPQTGAQIPVGCDPDRCRHPFGSHAETCRS